MRKIVVILATFLAFSSMAQPSGPLPQVGQLVPNLELVDDQGDPVKLRELTRGHYTVMILGCLT